MSKIICDVCGTAFDETDSRCPICGCTKSPNAQRVAEEVSQPETEKPAGGTYAKGGRYAKNNVRRSAPAYAAPKASERRRKNDDKDDEPQGSNKGLVAVVIVLLLAIVMVVVYIGVSVFFNGLTNQPDNNSSKPSTEATTEATEPSLVEIPCTELKLSMGTVEFESENKTTLLTVIPTPEDTTDVLKFESADPTVAVVDQNGVITPIGYGQTTITVTCGNITAECMVICSFGEAPTTEPTVPQITLPDGFVLELITYKGSGEITLAKEGEIATIYKETLGVKASDITWTVADPAVATVENGRVFGVDRGTTTVTATIGDQVATCLVRCAFDAAEPEETTGITISDTDVTLRTGDVFYLSLKNPDASKVQDVEWTASKEGLVEIDGNKITVLEITENIVITVSAEHEGVTYTCTLRLYPVQQETTGSEE